MNPIGDLVATLRDSLGYVMTGTVVAFFLLFVLLFWMWRGIALKDEEDES